MIVVTGGAGFIGSNLVKGLNERGRDDILVVDDLTDGTKFRNLVDCSITDYLDKGDFLERIKRNDVADFDAVFHEGACSTTTEWDGRYMLQNNYEYSKVLLHHCLERRIQFLYASSAAVYGAGPEFREEPACEAPLNVYGYSKLLFDQYVRRILPRAHSQVAGFRYFNVYGPREQHKGAMASVPFHHYKQIRTDGKVRLFDGNDGYEAGEQRRDFVYVGDAVDVNVWFLDHPDRSGIFNLGTGRAEAFNRIATAVIEHNKNGEIEYIEFPDHLKGRYQSYTEADTRTLREAGYCRAFHTVRDGVLAYMSWLDVHL